MTQRRRQGTRGNLLCSCSLVLALIAAFLGTGSESASASADVSVVGQFGGGLLNIPGGVAVGPSGAIYVVDTDNERIDQFTALHGFVGAWGFGVADGQSQFETCTTACVQGVASAGDGGFHAPAGIAVDASSGDLYVADSQNNRIDEFSAAGSFVRAWGWGVADGLSQFEVCTAGCEVGNGNSGAGGLSRPLGVTVDGSGDVIVADSFNNRIEEYSAAGAFIRAWGTAGGGAGQFQEPSGVATDASGDVYVTDDLNYRVEEFSSTGGFIRAWGWGVADGSAMFETCTVSCQAGIVGSGTGQFNYPLSEPSALAVDAAGNVDVADFDNGRVQQFSSAGTFLEMWGWGVTDGKSQFETCTDGCRAGVNGNGSGGLWDPDGMAIDTSGNVYVANLGTNLVQEYADPAAPTTHTLSVTDAGTGTGTVASSPSGISCGATCSAGFDAGATVTLTATPSGGSTFAGWSGAGCSGTSTCGVTMNADTTVTATFAAAAPVTHTLSVSDAGGGTGTVASSPSGISCGATCSAGFDAGATVTLTATPSGGSTFAGWSGAGCSGTSTCAVTMNADTTVTATFAAAPPVTHTLSVSDAGGGTGTVASSPSGISCGATCSAAFDAGATVTLTATPSGGSTFAGWSGGGCSGTSTCVVTMDADTSVTATFAAAASGSAPTVALQTTTGVTATSATLNATVNPQGAATTYQFSYGTNACTTTEVPATPASVGSDSASHVVSAAITGLSPATIYKVCVNATNVGGSVTTPTQTFKTSSATPTVRVRTDNAGDVGQVAATLRGGIGANGNNVTYHFEYGIDTSYGTSTPDAHLSANTRVLPVNAEIAGGLLPGTAYHFRLVATLGSSTFDGADATFVTQARPLTAATVQTLPSVFLGATGPRAFAGIYNSATALTYHFDYGATTAYGSSTPDLSAIAGTDSIEVRVPGTSILASIVHYRLVVTNAGGTAYGNDETYTQFTPVALTASVVSVGATSALVRVYLNADFPGTTSARFDLDYGTGSSRDLHASVPVTLSRGSQETVTAATVTLTGLTPATLYTADPSVALTYSTPSGVSQQRTLVPLAGPSVDPLILTAAASVSSPSPVSGGKVTQVVTCDSGPSCTGSFNLVYLTSAFVADDHVHAAPVTIAYVKFTARRGKKTKVVIKLSKTARKTLHKKHKLKVGETVTIKGPHGTTKTKKVLTLRGH